MQIDRVIAKGQLVPLTFMQDNLAASQSAVALTVAEVTGAAGNAVDGYVMPFAGQIIAVSYKTSAAATAGTMTIAPTVAGTAKTDPILSVTTGSSGYDKAARGTVHFDAGAVVGAKVTTTSTWDGTSADLNATVWVLLEVAGI